MTKTPSPNCETVCASNGPIHDLAEAADVLPLSSCTANELAIQAQHGEPAAFAELFRRYCPRLVRFLEKRLADPVDAEDVSQEALAKAWQSLASFDAKFQFTTWLYTIAVRTASDHTRRMKSGKQGKSPHRNLAPHDDIAGREIAPSAHLQQQENADNIWATAKSHLNQAQFSALWLRYGEDLTVKEVAKILNKTTVGTRVLLHRARAALQPYLLDYADCDPSSRSASEDGLS